MKKAIVTGITGQDGAYLAKLLLDNGYKVFGTYRRSSSVNFWRIDELSILSHPQLQLVEYDLTDLGATIKLINDIEPDEIYNLAAQSFVGVSFLQPTTTLNITGAGAVNILEAIKIVNRKIKFYQASTSEMFGKVQEIPQKESTPFYPRSPYGAAKLYAHWMTINYRESYDIFGASGILFNHESPLRGKEFVTRKITDAVSRISLGMQDSIKLGNLDAKRDWGFAQDYVEGMWKMLQTDVPDTYVLATGRTESIRRFLELAFEVVGISIEFIGNGIDEIAVDINTGKKLVSIDSEFFRPAEVDLLIGDPSYAKDKLNWTPKTNLEELTRLMVEADIKRNKMAVSF